MEELLEEIVDRLILNKSLMSCMVKVRENHYTLAICEGGSEAGPRFLRVELMEILSDGTTKSAISFIDPEVLGQTIFHTIFLPEE